MKNKEVEIVESFRCLAKNIVNFFENDLHKKTDINCSELKVLGVLYDFQKEESKINVTELANILKITKSAASQLITKLEKKGLVKRNLNLFDKKINYISINKEAIETYEKKRKEYEEVVDNVVTKMGDNDCKELSRLLNKLSNIIYKLGKDDLCA